jgi:hypothetical protein
MGSDPIFSKRFCNACVGCRHSPGMRVILFTIGLVLASAHVAAADSVIVMAGPEAEAAMRVVLAGRGTAVASVPAPVGQMRLERAAAAQRAAAQLGADAAVWIDEAEICAVTADGHDFRHAPFPAEAASPRAFAAIATSLLDEMIAPAPWAQGINVNVNVNVTPNGEVGFAGPPGTMGGPGLTFSAPRPERRNAGRTLIEVGPMLSPITAGVEGGIALPLSPVWRFAAMGAVNVTFDGDYILGVLGAELRHVGSGAQRHWDVGPMVGYAAPDGDDAVVFAGARLARTWEMESSALSLSLAPILMVPTSGTDPSIIPGVWSSLRWQFAL